MTLEECSKAIALTEELYGDFCDDMPSTSDISVAADIAACRIGINSSEFVRAYRTNRRHMQNLRPECDPFAEFA